MSRKSEAGFTPYNLDNAGKGDIQGIHNNNVGRTYSDEERNVLNSLEKNGPVLNNQGVESRQFGSGCQKCRRHI